MPDSEWTTITDAEAMQYETEFTAKGHDSLEPVGGVSYVPEVTHYDPPPPPPPLQQGQGEAWITTRTDTFSLLFKMGETPPDARPVQQYCTRCAGVDVDTLLDASHSPLGGIPYTPHHVFNDNEYGHRDGNLYLRYLIRGTQLKRTVRVDRFDDLVWGQKHVGPVKWERKRIDHIEQGPYIHWLTGMRRKDCNTQLSKRAYNDELIGEELMAMLHQIGATSSFLDDGGDIADVVAAAKRLKDPRFSVNSSHSGELDVTLLDRGDDGEFHETGTAKVRQHKGGFNTLVDWKPKP